MLTTIWDDIAKSAETIVIADTKYNPGSLSNLLYVVIDDRVKRHQLIRKNRVKGLFAELDDIRKHRDELIHNEDITMLIEGLFRSEEVKSIDSTDRIFLNSYYRRLLRAKIERDFSDKELLPGLIVTEYTNHETDIALVNTLRIYRLICRYLGIESTTHEGSFSIEKLYMPTLWRDISNKFIQLFGEERITPLEIDDTLSYNNMEAVLMFEGQKKIRQAQVLMLLNVVFNTWSGSTLILEGDLIKVVPATYVTRMLPKLR